MKHKLVLITGASSGLGQALALHYVRQGYQLALTGRHVNTIKSWLDAYAVSAESYSL